MGKARPPLVEIAPMRLMSNCHHSEQASTVIDAMRGMLAVNSSAQDCAVLRLLALVRYSSIEPSVKQSVSVYMLVSPVGCWY